MHWGPTKTDPVKFEFEKNFKPIQPQRRGVPYHLQGCLSNHLDIMRKEGAMEDINPREVVDCIMNLVITENDPHERGCHPHQSWYQDDKVSCAHRCGSET
jgi:hypothetical protein